jgi:hypothetical protein
VIHAGQKLLERGTILRRGDERDFFVTLAVNGKEFLGRASGAVHFLAKVERDDRVLPAVDDQDRSVDLRQPGLRIELRMYEEAESRQEPEDLARQSGSRRKGGFQDNAADFMVGC